MLKSFIDSATEYTFCALVPATEYTVFVSDERPLIQLAPDIFVPDMQPECSKRLSKTTNEKVIDRTGDYKSKLFYTSSVCMQ